MRWTDDADSQDLATRALAGRLTRVLVVAEEALDRAGIRASVVAGGAARVAAITDSARVGAWLDELARAAGPLDVAVWDLGPAPSRVPSPEFLRVVGALPTIALTRRSAPTGEILAWGARGVIDRVAVTETLRAAIAAVLAGLLVTSWPSPGEFPSGMVRTPDVDGGRETLTKREHEILQHLATGLTNRAIARRLDISDHTVKFHVNTLLGKLDAKTRTQAVANAARRGLVVF